MASHGERLLPLQPPLYTLQVGIIGTATEGITDYMFEFFLIFELYRDEIKTSNKSFYPCSRRYKSQGNVNRLQVFLYLELNVISI